jgi:hypothetical protein
VVCIAFAKAPAEFDSAGALVLFTVLRQECSVPSGSGFILLMPCFIILLALLSAILILRKAEFLRKLLTP